MENHKLATMVLLSAGLAACTAGNNNVRRDAPVQGRVTSLNITDCKFKKRMKPPGNLVRCRGASGYTIVYTHFDNKRFGSPLRFYYYITKKEHDPRAVSKYLHNRRIRIYRLGSSMEWRMRKTKVGQRAIAAVIPVFANAAGNTRRSWHYLVVKLQQQAPGACVIAIKPGSPDLKGKLHDLAVQAADSAPRTGCLKAT